MIKLFVLVLSLHGEQLAEAKFAKSFDTIAECEQFTEGPEYPAFLMMLEIQTTAKLEQPVKFEKECRPDGVRT
jgi:hypothetical protein